MYSDSHSNKDFTIDYYPDSDHDKDYYSSGLSNNNVILVSTFTFHRIKNKRSKK